jgi:hypothetical protein
MITIFCGEDSAAARSKYNQLIAKYKSSQAEIVSISPSSVLEVYQGLASNLSLFSSSRVYCVEGLEKFSFKKSSKAKKDTLYEALVALSQDKSIILLDYEDEKQARQLKLKDLAEVHESKPSVTIFKLLDECYPGNQIPFISSLRQVCIAQDEMFTFIMLVRHVRLLVLAAKSALSTKIPPWQKYKILDQSKKWEVKKLMDFYSGLIKIEIGAKTSNNPYGIVKSLEILACHYL